VESLLSGLSQHGYSLLFAVVFLEAVGLPVPAALALLVAGGASARGALYAPFAVTSALSAMVLADMLMFLLGRYTGWWLLGMLCRLSLNPESCILRSADSFHRRGRMLLVFAKFVPGINTMAPPLAGSMNMRAGQFLRLDFAGAALYVGSYFGIGFAFSGAADAITRSYHLFGRALNGLVIAAIVGYVGFQIWAWSKARVWRTVPFVRPSDAARAMLSNDAVIYDVRSHGYYDRKATRIQGSTRMDPNALHRLDPDFPPGKQVFLYCTCVRQATSARVAYLLREKGVSCTVIEGGLRAWQKAGLPLERVPLEEMAAMPAFDA
jgi:membrane protein DedA with SNARE-associated domain/rhodanese-related sulfurtransferase